MDCSLRLGMFGLDPTAVRSESRRGGSFACPELQSGRRCTQTERRVGHTLKASSSSHARARLARRECHTSEGKADRSRRPRHELMNSLTPNKQNKKAHSHSYTTAWGLGAGEKARAPPSSSPPRSSIHPRGSPLHATRFAFGGCMGRRCPTYDASINRSAPRPIAYGSCARRSAYGK